MRRRLLLVTVASAALVAVAFAIPLGILVRNVARDRAITAAERDASSLAPALAVTQDPSLIEGAITRTDTGADARLTVITPGGTVLGDPTPADPNAIDLVRRDQRSLTISSDDGLDLYSPVVSGTGDLSIIRAHVPNRLLDEGVTRAWFAVGGVALVLIAASAVVADRLARTMIGDAHRLADTATQLAGGDPTARAPDLQVEELDTAGRSLNLLAERIDELRTAERERVADLSHRLRTPLTALRLDADSSGDAAIIDDADRLEAAVTELIHAARRPLHEAPVSASCDAVDVTRERAEFWSAFAEDDDRAWTFETSAESAVVPCAEDELADALDALLGNIFAHTPNGTAFHVRVATGEPDRGVLIEIRDEGPGISTPDATARGATTDSSGLGLAIARRTAEDAGGSLDVESVGEGTTITLRLPVASRT